MRVEEGEVYTFFPSSEENTVLKRLRSTMVTHVHDTFASRNRGLCEDGEGEARMGARGQSPSGNMCALKSMYFSSIFFGGQLQK